MKRIEKYADLRAKLQKEAKADERIDKIVDLMNELVERFDRLLQELCYIAGDLPDPDEDFNEKVHKALEMFNDVQENRDDGQD